MGFYNFVFILCFVPLHSRNRYRAVMLSWMVRPDMLKRNHICKQPQSSSSNSNTLMEYNFIEVLIRWGHKKSLVSFALRLCAMDSSICISFFLTRKPLPIVVDMLLVDVFFWDYLTLHCSVCVCVCTEEKNVGNWNKKTGWNDIATLFVCVGHSYVLYPEQSEERETNINQAVWPKCSHTWTNGSPITHKIVFASTSSSSCFFLQNNLCYTLQ